MHIKGIVLDIQSPKALWFTPRHPRPNRPQETAPVRKSPSENEPQRENPKEINPSSYNAWDRVTFVFGCDFPLEYKHSYSGYKLTRLRYRYSNTSSDAFGKPRLLELMRSNTFSVETQLETTSHFCYIEPGFRQCDDYENISLCSLTLDLPLTMVVVSKTKGQNFHNIRWIEGCAKESFDAIGWKDLILPIEAALSERLAKKVWRLFEIRMLECSSYEKSPRLNWVVLSVEEKNEFREMLASCIENLCSLLYSKFHCEVVRDPQMHVNLASKYLSVRPSEGAIDRGLIYLSSKSAQVKGGVAKYAKHDYLVRKRKYVRYFLSSFAECKSATSRYIDHESNDFDGGWNGAGMKWIAQLSILDTKPPKLSEYDKVCKELLSNHSVIKKYLLEYLAVRKEKEFKNILKDSFCLARQISGKGVKVRELLSEPSICKVVLTLELLLLTGSGSKGRKNRIFNEFGIKENINNRQINLMKSFYMDGSKNIH